SRWRNAPWVGPVFVKYDSTATPGDPSAGLSALASLPAPTSSRPTRGARGWVPWRPPSRRRRRSPRRTRPSGATGRNSRSVTAPRPTSQMLNLSPELHHFPLHRRRRLDQLDLRGRLSGLSAHTPTLGRVFCRRQIAPALM